MVTAGACPARRSSESRVVDQQGENAALRSVRRARFSVLGTLVDALQIPDVIAPMRDWIMQRDACRYIGVAGMHGIMEARHNAEFKRALAEADLVVPDGMPLIWIGRFQGHVLSRRVYGPELMLEFCRGSALEGWRHFLYGGESGVPERLAKFLTEACPGIRIAGAYSPPFRPPTTEEDAVIVEMINQADADVLWVGLSTPKQELWMHQHRQQLRVPVIVGVGAAFDFLTSRKKQAPAWMRDNGLEWFHRLLQEPRRLWRRYLIKGSEFVFLVALEVLGLRRFE
jgi:N-acetylglucosaminyldiphosphoundecaprenol N-acetyl-beta-D-mannosaminyltransferase